MSTNDPNPGIVLLEQAAIAALAAALPVFTQGGMIALTNLLTQMIQKHGQ